MNISEFLFIFVCLPEAVIRARNYTARIRAVYLEEILEVYMQEKRTRLHIYLEYIQAGLGVYVRCFRTIPHISAEDILG